LFAATFYVLKEALAVFKMLKKLFLLNQSIKCLNLYQYDSLKKCRH